MNKILRFIIDVFAYYLERLRLRRFSRKNGISYAANHREEWMRYARDNWASRYLHRCVR